MGLTTTVTSTSAGAGSVPLKIGEARPGSRSYGASPALLCRSGKENCLGSRPSITAPTVVTSTNSNTVAVAPTAAASVRRFPLHSSSNSGHLAIDRTHYLS